MKNGPLFIFIAVALTIGGFAGGYQFAQQKTDVAEQTSTVNPEKGQKPKLLYYRNPMGLPDTSPTPRKTRWAWTTFRSMKAKTTQQATAA